MAKAKRKTHNDVLKDALDRALKVYQDDQAMEWEIPSGIPPEILDRLGGEICGHLLDRGYEPSFLSMDYEETAALIRAHLQGGTTDWETLAGVQILLEAIPPDLLESAGYTKTGL